MTNDRQPLTKNQKREHARELARETREAEQKRKKRRRLITQGSVILGALAIVAVVALVVTTSAKPTTGPLNMLSDGIVITGDGSAATAVSTAALQPDSVPVATDVSESTDVANIVVYLDYLCPYCGNFENTNGEQIASWVTSGAATLEVHPISILDSQSLGSEYSTRSANAAACVANYDPDNFLAVNTALFADQPEEATTGLTDDELVELIAAAGSDGDDVASCITDGTFSEWVAGATERALEGPLPNTEVAAVTGTPTVLVNGSQYTGALDDPEAFSTFVTDVMTAAAEETPTE
ncbi:protein-disulfide isomerase [Glaciihabitans tibetensis]|uniref:Protein-disulfide isomerase n=1 Tax=Glaciihabitans tibetensis TaxID=1266600 RepID=A0A2T0VIT1_9MICO|nr:thioredoxin domain-containing protein [Glaciihabitans tibetensis]PRY70132.1 protein-disulfide isomerase [Glaciihabitans tibetensis]